MSGGEGIAPGAGVLSAEQAGDLEDTRLVERFQAGHAAAFSEIYSRWFDRVYGYLKVVLRDPHEAEDLTQQVFVQVLEALPRYEHRGIPFRSWLITLVRNRALKHIRKQSRIEVETAEAIARRQERKNGDTGVSGVEIPSLGWLSDHDLLVLVEHLPMAQRQVLVLRFLLDLTPSEIAQALHRTPNQVRVIQHRALTFLKKRLTSLGREPKKPDRDRTATRRIVKQATVIRHRRHALSP